MNNYVQRGHVVTVTAPGDRASGAWVEVGELTGIAAHAALSGEDVEIIVKGVVDAPKDGGAINLNAPVYLGTGIAATGTASTRPEVGISLLAAESGDATVRMLLVPTVRGSVAG